MPRNLLLLAVIFAGILSFAVAYFAFGAPTKRHAGEPPPADAGPAENNAPPRTNPEPAKPKVPRPVIVSRQEWKAKEPRGTGTDHAIHCITIHHTGMPQKANATLEKKLQNLQTYSQSESKLASGKTKPAWLDVPYHFYIAVDGRIGEGRPIRFVSDTNTEYDPTRHATIVLEGNFEIEEPTAEQQKSLQALVAWLSEKYQVPASRIKAHNDYAKTACPGAKWKKTLPELREKVVERTGPIAER